MAMAAFHWDRGRDRVAVVAGVVAPLAVAAALVPVRGNFPNTDAALVLVGVVVAVAANGHRLAGWVAAASAALWFDYFLTQPYEQFTINRRGDIETTLLLLLVGGAVTELAVRGRRHRGVAVTGEGYLSAIGATMEAIAARRSPTQIIDEVGDELTSLLGLSSWHFERLRAGGLPVLQADGQLRWGTVLWDVDNDGLPDTPIELSATCNGYFCGRYLVEFAEYSRPPIRARQVAAILAEQVGVALSRELASPRSGKRQHHAS